MAKIKEVFDLKLLKFLFVGVLNTIVGYLLIVLFMNLMNLGYWPSTALSYILASIMSYFLNKYFTFKNTEKGIKPVLRFSLNIAVCYVLAYGIAQPLVEWFVKLDFMSMWISSVIGTEPLLSLFGGNVQKFSDNVAVLAGMGLFMCFNYLGQRFFAFKQKNTDDAQKSISE